MRLERLRVVVATLPLAILGLLVGPTGASACQFPDLTLSPGTYKPGDSVGFSASNTLGGASVTIHVGSQDIVQTDPGVGDPGFEGSFKMPNLGDSPMTL